MDIPSPESLSTHRIGESASGGNGPFVWFDGTVQPLAGKTILHKMQRETPTRTVMRRELIRDALLLSLADLYQKDPRQFLTLSQQTVDSSLAREVIAQLRIDGFIEEDMRGVIRLTARGYRDYRNDPLPYAFRN